MTENDLDFVLDGNAAAGALGELFAADVTTAYIQCDACWTCPAFAESVFKFTRPASRTEAG